MNLLNFFQSVKATGGGSYNIHTGELNPKDGYMVSINGCETVVDYNEDFDIEVRRYIKKNMDVIYEPNIFLGAWTNDGKVYLDCSQKIVDKREALHKGLRRNQKAIWDNTTLSEIALPPLQKCGTEYQKASYLNLKLEELLNNKA